MHDETIELELEWAAVPAVDVVALGALYPVDIELLDRLENGWPVFKVRGIRRQVRGFLLAEYVGGNVDDLNGIAGLVADLEGRL